MNTADATVSASEVELSESEANKYYWLITNPDKRRSTRAFVRQGGNRRQDHGTRGNAMSKGINNFVTWKNSRFGYDDAEIIIKRRVFRAAGRRITGTM